MKILLGTPLKIERWTVISGGAVSDCCSTTPVITPAQSPGRGCQSEPQLIFPFLFPVFSCQSPFLLHLKCLHTHSTRTFNAVSVFVSAVEQEKDLLQPRPYWKEFRFDLTPLPQGETVTAAEFRIYKTLTMGWRANRTLHISVYEIQREKRHRPVHI